MATSQTTRFLWLVAIATFLVGDIATTWIGLNLVPGVVEGHPVSAAAFEVGGFGTIFLLKGVVVGVAILMFTVAPDDWKVGVPLGLAAIGTIIVAINVNVLLTALGI